MTKFHSIEVLEIENLLKTNLIEGLSAQEAQGRFKLYGQNRFKNVDKDNSVTTIFFRQFQNPLMFLLIFAAVASILLQEYSDTFVITGALLFNVFLGFFQELKAKRVAENLAEKAVDESLVMRAGKLQKIKGHLLVPGDIVILSTGDAIQADLRLFESNFLKVKEAELTGESVDVLKDVSTLPEQTALGDRVNMAFAGTFVVAGSGQGIVVATGNKTQSGQIEQLLIDVKAEKTPLQKQIEHISWVITVILFVIMFFIVLGGLLRGMSFAKILSTAIAVAVAEVPEGLMIAITVILTIGAQRMFKQKALVRTLLSTEALGSVSIICTDKTGTLTEGQMMLEKIVTLDNCYDPEREAKTLNADALNILELASHTSEAKIIAPEKFTGDEVEVAILRSLLRVYAHQKNQGTKTKLVEFLPFDSTNQFAASIIKSTNETILAVKGSHEKILGQMCAQNINTKNFLKMAELYTRDGMRVLALAAKTTGNLTLAQEIVDLEPLGLLCFSDPLRQTAKATIETIHGAGVRVVMITGDHKQTALNIAQQAGIPATIETVLDGHEIEALTDLELQNMVSKVNVFARVSPQDKIKIVQAFKAAGHVTAMTGDGANDAPALKAANIGLAVGSGSQIAKNAAEVVLLNSNLETIGKAIAEGRIIFENIRKIFMYFLADGFAEATLIITSLIFNVPLPFLPAQLLWINLIADSVSSFSLTQDPGENDIMRQKPRAKDAPFFSNKAKSIFFLSGVLANLILFFCYLFLLKMDCPLDLARTIMFQLLTINILFYLFSVRALKKSIWCTNLLANRGMVLSVIVGVILQIIVLNVGYLRTLLKLVPIPAQYWLLILPLSLTKLVCMEVAKILLPKKEL